MTRRKTGPDRGTIEHVRWRDRDKCRRCHETGEQETAGPSITDALKIARFAADDYRSIKGVDEPDAPVGVTAEDLLEHFTRTITRKA